MTHKIKCQWVVVAFVIKHGPLLMTDEFDWSHDPRLTALTSGVKWTRASHVTMHLICLEESLTRQLTLTQTTLMS